jgi:hypothetical protein
MQHRAFPVIGIREFERERNAKRDETVAFRVPEMIASWLRDRCRVLSATRKERVTPSCLMREIVTHYLEAEQGRKRFSPFANISDQERRALISLVRKMA